jgi:hypothetical protein
MRLSPRTPLSVSAAYAVCVQLSLAGYSGGCCVFPAAVVDFSTVAEQMLCVEGMIEGLPDTTIVQVSTAAHLQLLGVVCSGS